MSAPTGTFGGSHLDRYLFDFEAVPDAPAADAGAEAGAEAVTDATATADVEAGPPSPEAPAAPAWTPDDPAFIDAVDSRAAEIAQAQIQQVMAEMRQGGNTASGTDAQVDFDPNEFLNPLADNFGENLFQLLQQFTQQAQAPYQEQRQQQALAEGQQRMDDIVADDFARHGAIELPEEAGVKPTEIIKQIAPLFLSEMEGRYGQNGPRAAEAALGKAAGLVRQIVTAAEKAGASKASNELATLAGAQAEPGTAGAAIHGGDPAGSVDEAIARAFARSAG